MGKRGGRRTQILMILPAKIMYKQIAAGKTVAEWPWRERGKHACAVPT